MPVTSFFTIGSLSVPSSWIALMVAFVVAYSAVRFRFGKKQAEIIGDAFFYLVIVWKLSIVLTDFNSVLRSPLAIVYFHGGAVGFYLGLLFIVGKTLWDMKKGRLDANGFRALFTGAVLVQVVYQVIMVLLNEGEMITQVVTVVVFGLFAVFFWMNSGKADNWPVQLALVFMAVHVFVAAVQPDEFIQTPLITTVVMGLFFVIVFMRKLDWRDIYE
ncbi:hypothetical protein MKY15_02340 [Sporosarcina sp. FSL K6-1540]|uniref:hypothetical protein n=1 Tax=Sporosarcina sp. FSL K6-1540 TaxID=2921555 RepID=UPI00315AF928